MIRELCSSETSWFALRTRCNHERTVGRTLESKGVETFYPQVRETRRVRTGNRILHVPLFPGYLFGRFAATERILVLQTRGLIEILGNRAPIPVPEQQIESIRKMLDSKLLCTSYPFLVEGAKVGVRQGALAGSEGVLLQQNRRDFFVVLIPLLGRSVAVEIEGSNLYPLMQ